MAMPLVELAHGTIGAATVNIGTVAGAMPVSPCFSNASLT